MLALELNFEDGGYRVFEAPLPISIGRSSDCDLRLKAWRVGRQHANIERRAAGIFIDDLGTLAGTFVNGRRVAQYGPLSSMDEIIIGPCLMRLLEPGRSPSGQCDGTEGGAAAYVSSRDADEFPIPVLPLATIAEPAPTTFMASAERPYPDYCKSTGDNTIKLPLGLSTQTKQDLTWPRLATDQAASHDMHQIDNLENALPGADVCNADDTRSSAERDAYARQCRRLHGALLEALDLRRRDIAVMSDTALRTEASSVLSDILADDDAFPCDLDRDQLIRTVVDEAVGLGPLEPLLADSRVSEIMVNRHDEIFIESAGQLRRHAGGFSSEQAVLGVIERIVSPLGRRIDESSPMVDARLRDGSRVNAVIPPIALRGASITIRKFPTTRPRMADLLRVGALDVNISDFLAACVMQRKNIIVSGGTGSGKTTLLNILSSCIPSSERIVTIEDSAELQLDHEHLVSLEARPANMEGRGAVLIRDLVRNALRMRPDRIVVGECRGAEAFDMLAAMNTGHEGSLTTLHANSPRDALNRLETMILMAGMDLPLPAVREHVSSSVDIIVQQARLSSGRRVITSIVQVTGQESGRIQLQELFQYQPGPPSLFVGCGTRPDGLELDGVGLSIDTFNSRSEVHACATGW